MLKHLKNEADIAYTDNGAVINAAAGSTATQLLFALYEVYSRVTLPPDFTSFPYDSVHRAIYYRIVIQISGIRLYMFEISDTQSIAYSMPLVLQLL